MRLSPEQLKDFDEQGYLFLPECFSDEEVAVLRREAERDGQPGIVAPTGKPGSVLMFHGNLVHASAPNITPYPRKIVYLTLCAVSNHITKFNRPEFIAHRDFTPIQQVSDGALVEHARARRVAAE